MNNGGPSVRRDFRVGTCKGMVCCHKGEGSGVRGLFSTLAVQHLHLVYESSHTGSSTGSRRVRVGGIGVWQEMRKGQHLFDTSKRITVSTYSNPCERPAGL